MKTLKEALFSRKNVNKKELNLKSNTTLNCTLSIEISNDKASFIYDGMHFKNNINIKIVISIEDAKFVVEGLGAKHYKAGKTINDIYDEDNYIYCDSSGKAIILGHRDHSYDVIFWLDEEQIKEIKELFE